MRVVSTVWYGTLVLLLGLAIVALLVVLHVWQKVRTLLPTRP